jgi:hypothetical protein
MPWDRPGVVPGRGGGLERCPSTPTVSRSPGRRPASSARHGERRTWPPSTPASPAAAPVRGWSPGARRWHGSSGRPSATRTTGAARCPASARPTPGSPSSGWPPPPTAATAPAGSSPATAAATGSSRRCGGPVWPASRRPRTSATASSSPESGSPPRCAARHRPTRPPRRSATRARRGWPASWRCCRGCASSSSSAASAGRPCGRCSPRPGTRYPVHGRRSVTASRWSWPGRAAP